MEITTTKLDDLPEELHKIISLFLNNDDKSLRTLRAVNTKWLNTIKYSKFNLYFTRPADLPLLGRLARYNHPLHLQFRKIIAKTDAMVPALSGLTNLVSLNFQGSVSHPAWMSLTSLTNLTSLLATSPPYDLLKSLTNIKRIQMDDLLDSEARELTVLRQLECLLYTADSDNGNFDWLLHPSKLTFLSVYGFLDDETNLVNKIAQCVNLKQLTYDFCSNWETFEYIKTLTALESLSIGATADIDLAYHTRLTFLELTTKSFPKNIQLLQRLKTFCWTCQSNLELDDSQTLTALTSLETVVCEFHWMSADILKRFPTSLISLSPNLRYTEKHHIEHLTNLERLYLQHGLSDDILTDVTNLTSLVLETPTTEQICTLARLTKLKSLRCSYPLHHTGSALWESGVLHHLPNLEDLRCEQRMPENCYLPPKLTNLWAMVDEHVDCSFLTRLTSLESLKLYYATPKEWPIIAQLTTLEDLCTLSARGSDEDIQCLTALTKLKYLAFSLLSDANESASCDFITSLTNLQAIYYQTTEECRMDNFICKRVPKEELQKKLTYLYIIDD